MHFNDNARGSFVSSEQNRAGKGRSAEERRRLTPLVLMLASSLCAPAWAEPALSSRVGLTAPAPIRATAAAPSAPAATTPTADAAAAPTTATPPAPKPLLPAPTKGAPLAAPPAARPETPAEAAPVYVRDVAHVGGTNSNPLVGYGMVIGLQGTGDTQGTISQQMLTRMLQTLGMTQPLSNQTNFQAITMKNAAVVMLTAELPAFARSGDTINVRVASVADAKSLVGGVLAVSLLKAADGQVYATAQGPLVVGDRAATGTGIGVQTTKPHLNSGIVLNGGLVSRTAPASRLDTATTIQWVLEKPDFEMASRVAAAINRTLPGVVAVARDSTVVEVDLRGYEAQGPTVEIVSQMSRIQLDVSTSKVTGKVTYDTRDGELLEGADVPIRRGVVHAAGARIEVTEEGATVGDMVRYLAQLGFPTARRAEVLRALRRDNLLRADLKFQAGVTEG